MPVLRPSIALTLTLIVVAAAYSNVTSVGFMWDDKTLIAENPAAHQILPLSNFFGRNFWSHPFADGQSNTYFRPLVVMSFAVDWVIGSGDASTFHLTNVLAHLAACALVFLLAQQRGAPAAASALAAMIFGLFPRLTESVTWVVGRTDVFATAFALLGLWLETRKPANLTNRFAVAVALLLALLSKEVAVAVLVVLAASSIERLRTRAKTFRAELVAALPLLAAVAAYVVLRAASSAARPLKFHALVVSLSELGSLTSMSLTPWFPNAQVGFVGDTPAWALLLGLVFLGFSVWLIFVRKVLWWWATVIAMVMVAVPNLGVLTPASDRFLYLPVAIAACLAAPLIRSPTRGVVAAALVMSFIPMTFMRNALWADELDFWRRTFEQADPRNAAVEVALGDALFTAHGPAEALEHYRNAIKNGVSAQSFVGLSVASALSASGQDQAALAHLATLDRDRKRNAFDEALFNARALEFEKAVTLLPRLEKRYGRDEAFERLERVVTEGQSQWAQAKSPIERAKVYDLLGAVVHAQEQYELVLSDAASSEADRRAALAWLVIRAPISRADAALAQLRADHAPPETLDGLQAILDDRR